MLQWQDSPSNLMFNKLWEENSILSKSQVKNLSTLWFPNPGPVISSETKALDKPKLFALLGIVFSHNIFLHDHFVLRPEFKSSDQAFGGRRGQWVQGQGRRLVLPLCVRETWRWSVQIWHWFCHQLGKSPNLAMPHTWKGDTMVLSHQNKWVNTGDALQTVCEHSRHSSSPGCEEDIGKEIFLCEM